MSTERENRVSPDSPTTCTISGQVMHWDGRQWTHPKGQGCSLKSHLSGDPVTAPDVVPVPPLVDVIAEVLAGHWTFSTHGDFDALVDRCDGCHADIFTHGHDADQKTAWATHQARAVLAALKQAGTVEWGVRRGRGNIESAPDRFTAEQWTKSFLAPTLVSRFVGTWKALG